MNLSAVDGMGGVGKTALAIKVGHALRAEFPDLQLFVELRAHGEQPPSAGQALEGLLNRIDPRRGPSASDEARRADYLRLFHDPAGRLRHGLVILDDARDAAQVDALRPPAGIPLLVTSRQRLGLPCEAQPLDRLPPAAAAELLRAYRPDLDDDDAAALAELCGHLPVALRAAGGYLGKYRAAPVAEYLAELRRHRLETLGSVSHVFAASYRRLDKAERAAWTALSVMPAGFGRHAALAVIAAAVRPGRFARLLRRPTPDPRKLVDGLESLHLLDYDAGRYGWHDLLREYAAGKLAKQRDEAARVAHAEHYTDVANQADYLYLQGGEDTLRGLALFDRERPHLEAAFAFLAARPRQARTLLRLVNGVAWTSLLRFDPRQHIRWLEAQVDAARRARDRAQEGAALGNLGLAHADLGEPRRAIEFYEQRLDIAHEIGDRRGEGGDLWNSALAHDALDQRAEALDLAAAALAIYEAIEDPWADKVRAQLAAWRGEGGGAAG